MNASLAAAVLGTFAARILATNGVPAVPAASNLLINGDFSRGDLRRNWAPLYAGSKAIVGWDVIGPIDYVSSAYWQTAGGARSIDLDGTPGPGAISQTFATTHGDTYLVRFDLAANTEGGPKVKRVLVTVGGTSRTFSVDTSGRSNAAMHYAHESLGFVASADSATLEFASLSRRGNWNGAVIASIMVTDETAGISGETARAAPAADYSAASLASTSAKDENGSNAIPRPSR